VESIVFPTGPVALELLREVMMVPPGEGQHEHHDVGAYVVVEYPDGKVVALGMASVRESIGRRPRSG
jgi:hypothetical protein